MLKQTLVLAAIISVTIPQAAAYPLQFGQDTSASIVLLKTPEFAITTVSEDTISIHVTFENKERLFEGLIWDMKQFPYAEDAKKSLDELYENAKESRIMSVTIKDDSSSLDYNAFKVSSDYNLIATADHTEGFVGSLQLEILDIEQNVIGDMFKSSLEFDFEITSPELVIGESYAVELYTNAGGLASETFEMTLPETKPIEEPEPTIDPEPQKVITEIPQEPEPIAEPQKNPEPEMDPEHQMDPEPVGDYAPQTIRCGAGEIIEDGQCVPAKTESNPFADFLKMLFGLFG